MKRLLKTARNWHYVDLRENTTNKPCWRCGKPAKYMYDAIELDYDDTFSDLEEESPICEDCSKKYVFENRENVDQLIKDLPDSFDEWSKLSNEISDFDMKHMKDYQEQTEELGYEYHMNGIDMWRFEDMSEQERKAHIKQWKDRMKQKEEEIANDKKDKAEYKSNDEYDNMDKKQKEEIQKIKYKK